jgi:hypothetical protein
MPLSNALQIGACTVYTASVIGKATIEFSLNKLRASSLLSTHAASFGENNKNGVFYRTLNHFSFHFTRTGCDDDGSVA